MQDLGTISIITPSFNRADIIHETAQSIFNQTYPYWEWVIVDDGSTDNSWEVINEFAAKDPRVKIYKRDREPKGACSCRNIAIERSTGSYLLFLDSDDLLASFCLEQRINAAHRYPESKENCSVKYKTRFPRFSHFPTSQKSMPNATGPQPTRLHQSESSICHQRIWSPQPPA